MKRMRKNIKSRPGPKHKNRFWLWVLALCLAAGLGLPEVIQARTSNQGSIEAVYLWKEQPVSGLSVSLYKIADASGRYEPDFEQCPDILFASQTEETSLTEEQLEILEKYISLHDVKAFAVQTTDAQGITLFDGLEAGVYFLEAGDYTDPDEQPDPVTSSKIQFQPALIRVEENAITLYPKSDLVQETAEEYEILAVWLDEGFESQRPETFFVEIFNDSQKQLQAGLTADQQWKQTWQSTQKGIWSLEPQKLEGYQIDWVQEGHQFIVYIHRQENPKEDEAQMETYRVQILWADKGHEDVRPDFVEIAVKKDGQTEMTLTASAENDWTCTWLAESGASWSVEQTDLPDRYSQSLEIQDHSFTFINAYQNLYTLKKVWETPSDAAAEVTIDLYRDGVLTDTVVLNSENDWTCTWQSSYEADHWQIEEQTLAGFVPSYYQNQYTFLCTNKKAGSSATGSQEPDNPLKPTQNESVATAWKSDSAFWILLMAAGAAGLTAAAIARKKRGSQ